MLISRVIRAAAIVALVLLAHPGSPSAQDPGKVGRVGILLQRTRAEAARYNDPFLQGLRDLGWVEGKNLVIEYRAADGHPERLPALAAELVRANVDVIFAGPSAAAGAAKSVTKTVPIVVGTGADVVELGLVESLARPGGNITGVAWDVSFEIFGKGLELLKECLPNAQRIAVLSNPGNPSQPAALKQVQARGRSLGLRLQLLTARNPAEIDQAFAVIGRDRADAVFVIADALLGFHRARILEHAARRRLPAMYGLREFPESGGLMSYGPDVTQNFRRAATYVDKILKGARPADLPMEQPTKYELVINRKTANALGITIAPSFLLRADQIIE